MLSVGYLILLTGIISSAAMAQVGVPMSFYIGGNQGTTTYNGVPAPPGSIIDVYDLDYVHCGRDTVTETLGAGRYGVLDVLGDDPDTEADEGPLEDEYLIFELNGRPATPIGPDEPIWDGVWYPYKEVNLEATGAVSADFVGPEGKMAAPGDIVHYSVGVTNTGEGMDFYTITASSGNGWLVSHSGGFTYADQGETISISFVLSVPPGDISTSDQIEFTVTSGLDDMVTFTGTVITLVSPTDIENNGNSYLPGGFQLYQNYPNPFNPVTVIAFDLPSSSIVDLSIYDLMGRRLQSHSLGRLGAGHHSFTFEAGSLSSGVYFYKLRAGDFSEIKRMVLLK
jgi:hypothetical protein